MRRVVGVGAGLLALWASRPYLNVLFFNATHTTRQRYWSADSKQVLEYQLKSSDSCGDSAKTTLSVNDTLPTKETLPTMGTLPIKKFQYTSTHGLQSVVELDHGVPTKVIRLSDSYGRSALVPEMGTSFYAYKCAYTLPYTNQTGKDVLITLFIPSWTRRVTIDSDLAEGRSEYAQVMEIKSMRKPTVYYSEAFSMYGKRPPLKYVVGQLVKVDDFDDSVQSYRDLGNHPGIYFHLYPDLCKRWAYHR